MIGSLTNRALERIALNCTRIRGRHGVTANVTMVVLLISVLACASAEGAPGKKREGGVVTSCELAKLGDLRSEVDRVFNINNIDYKSEDASKYYKMKMDKSNPLIKSKNHFILDTITTLAYYGNASIYEDGKWRKSDRYGFVFGFNGDVLVLKICFDTSRAVPTRD